MNNYSSQPSKTSNECPEKSSKTKWRRITSSEYKTEQQKPGMIPINRLKIRFSNCIFVCFVLIGSIFFLDVILFVFCRLYRFVVDVSSIVYRIESHNIRFDSNEMKQIWFNLLFVVSDSMPSIQQTMFITISMMSQRQNGQYVILIPVPSTRSHLYGH